MSTSAHARGTAPLVAVEDLRVVARGADGREFPIVHGASFTVAPGEVVALIGESGSGKTTVALSLLGYARPGCRIVGGRVRLGETEVLGLAPAGLRDLRGRRVSYVAQSAAASFNPSRTIMAQVTETALIHGVCTRAEAEGRAVELFRALALPNPERVGARFPHQVSGGQLQRLMAAMALIAGPELVVLDEPTTALDVTTQVEVLRAFKAVVRDRGATAVYVSHDLAVVAQIADRIVVLRDGAIQEVGATGTILSAPAHPYTRSLLAAAALAPREVVDGNLCEVVDGDPRGDVAAEPAGVLPVLAVQGLLAGYGGRGRDGMPAIPVLRDIELSVHRGKTLGVIGESGCGKSTLARVVAGLLPQAAGTVSLNGVPLAPGMAHRTRDQLRKVQLVFQMADTALNPAHTVSQILSRPIAFFHGAGGKAGQARVRRLLDLVQLPAAVADRLPGELSGGQKQRVNLARALAAEPDLLLCDEVTSALDTVVGAAVLKLLDGLRRELGLAVVFISHDLHLVRAMCDEVLVLYAGRAVEAGPTVAVDQSPRHPYSDLLIASVPELRPGWLEKARNAGEATVIHGARVSGACDFFPRCPVRVPGRCDAGPVPVRPLSKGTAVLCQHDEAALLALGC